MYKLILFVFQDKINKQIVSEDTGRLFSVVFLRGSQHKVTSGDLFFIYTCNSLSMINRTHFMFLICIKSFLVLRINHCKIDSS